MAWRSGGGGDFHRRAQLVIMPYWLRWRLGETIQGRLSEPRKAFHLISMEMCSSLGSIRRIHTQKEKWNGKWERSGFSQLSFSQSHLELELDLTVKNGEHTSQPTRRRDRARRTGFSSSFTYSRVAPNLFLSLRQRNLLFLVCVSIQGVIAWKETTPQCRFVALTFCLKKKRRIVSLNVFLKTVTPQKMLNFWTLGAEELTEFHFCCQMNLSKEFVDVNKDVLVF